EIVNLQKPVRRVPAAPAVVKYALDLVHATRPDNPAAMDVMKRMVSWGAGPRAVQFLILGGKARAVLHGNYHVSTDDIRAVAHAVLRHRIITNFSAQAEGYSADRLVDDLLAKVKANAGGLVGDSQVGQVLKEPLAV